jgi:hypothetical protein
MLTNGHLVWLILFAPLLAAGAIMLGTRRLPRVSAALSIGAVALGFAPEDHFRQTDLQVAAVCRQAQQRQFGEWAAQFPSRLASLDSERLMADPAEVLGALGAHYGLGAPPEAMRALASGKAFTSHSKSGAAYSAARRAADYAAIRAAHADEIAKVVVWAEAVAASAGLPLTPPLPLLS